MSRRFVPWAHGDIGRQIRHSSMPCITTNVDAHTKYEHQNRFRSLENKVISTNSHALHTPSLVISNFVPLLVNLWLHYARSFSGHLPLDLVNVLRFIVALYTVQHPNSEYLLDQKVHSSLWSMMLCGVAAKLSHLEDAVIVPSRAVGDPCSSPHVLAPSPPCGSQRVVE
jgi:hypothetical protein